MSLIESKQNNMVLKLSGFCKLERISAVIKVLIVLCLITSCSTLSRSKREDINPPEENCSGYRYKGFTKITDNPETTRIFGNVKICMTRKAISGATVIFRDSEGKIIEKALTDNKGKFDISSSKLRKTSVIEFESDKGYLEISDLAIGLFYTNYEIQARLFKIDESPFKSEFTKEQVIELKKEIEKKKNN